MIVKSPFISRFDPLDLGLGKLGSTAGGVIRQLLSLPTFGSDGKLVPGSWEDNRSDDILLYGYDNVLRVFDGNMLPYEGSRVVKNLWPQTDDSDAPTTQTITVVAGHEYQLQIGAGSASGATAVCSGAFTGTLSGDGSNIIAWNSGTPKTATTTSLTVTITGSVANIQLEDVTAQTNQNPSEYQTANGSNDGIAIYNIENGNTVNGSGVVAEAAGALLNTDIGENYSKVVHLGDSITLQANTEAYIGYLSNSEHVDAGSGGDRLADMDARYATDVTALNPSAVIIEGGSNDVLYTDETHLVSMQASLQSMVAKAEAAGHNIILANIPPWKNFTSWNTTRQSLTDDYNSWLATYATTNGYPLIDRYGLLEDPSNPDELLYDNGDGLHVSPLGHRKIADDGILPVVKTQYLAVGQRPTTTNLCENYNLNPTDTTGITPSGAGVSLSVVTDSQLFTEAPEIAQVCSGSVYELSSSTGYAFAFVDGYPGDTDAHYYSVWARTDGGGAGGYFGIGSATALVYLIDDVWRFYVFEQDPAIVSPNSRLTLTVTPGETIHFIANSITKSQYLSLIEVAGASASQDVTQVRHPYNSNVFNQDSGFAYTDLTPEQAQSVLSATDEGILSIADSATNLLFVDDGNLQSTDGTNTATVDPNYAADTKIRFLVYWDKVGDVLGVGYRTLPGGTFTWATEQAFDDAFASGSWFNLFYGNAHIWKMHDMGVFTPHQSQTYYEASY